MTPFFVSSQGNPMAERRLKPEGSRRGGSLILKHRNKPYMSSRLSAEYFSTVLLSWVDKLRSNKEFADKEAVLLMDNCSVRVQGDTLQMLVDHRVKVLTLPQHTIPIFQSLDLSLFGNFKKRMNYRLPLETDETTAGVIKRIFHMMKQTLVEDTVRSSFMRLGLTYDIDNIPCVLIFDEYVLLQSPEFTSLWEQDYPVEKLSQRRRNATFGWINKMMRSDWNSRE
jgi:hypothetical protein